MSDGQIRDLLATARNAQSAWSCLPVKQRLRVLRPLRRTLAAHPERFAGSVQLPQRHSIAETIGAEILPLADACRFLERSAEKLLRPLRLGASGRPLWLWGTHTKIHRDPHGLILIIGTWNYPLLLTGVQALQAIIAGNAALIKPAPNWSEAMQILKEELESAGLPSGLCTILPESPAAAKEAIGIGVDHVVLTGSAETGQTVLHQLADTLTPATMELSGCDALFVLPDADYSLVAKALAFGLRFNSSATCIASRRIFVPREELAAFQAKLRGEMDSLPKLFVSPSTAKEAQRLARQSIQQGAQLWFGGLDEECEATDHPAFPLILSEVTPQMAIARADVFAPIAAILPYDSLEEVLAADRKCPYALSSSVFGPTHAAEDFAKRVEAGSVMVNDVIAPTADPRLGFGGRRRSGFGLTRGAAGLLSMTVPKAVIVRRSGWRMHFRAPSPKIEKLLRGYLKCVHGGRWKHRFQGVWEVMKGVFSK